MMEALQHDTNLWVLFSFILFIAVAYKMGKNAVLGALDGRIESIRKEIETAENLRVEAQELLAQYQRKQRDAQTEAESIIKKAENSAAAIKEKAEADHKAVMARREAQLTERLKRIEENAIAEIQNYAAEVAVNATAEIIAQTLNQKTNDNLVDASIQGSKKYLN